MTRRELLQRSGVGLATTLAQRSLVHASDPQNLSYPLKLIKGTITAPNQFFVRDHFAPPLVSLDSWKLRVEGHIERPYDLSFSDLVESPTTKLEAVLECAGNVAGGAAVSNGVWEGVPISVLLERAGPVAGSEFLMFEGADEGQLLQDGPRLPYSQVVPLDKCLEPSSLIAFRLNELALPAKNGFPARALFPAWYGMDSVKWLRRIVVLTADNRDNGFFKSGMNRVYNRVSRVSGLDSIIRLSTIQVKSAIVWPADGQSLPVGRHIVWGFAWSGAVAIKEVAVTTLGGKEWADATLDLTRNPYGWVKWTYHWNATPGDYVIMSRASDHGGNSQPLRRDPARRDAYELNSCPALRCSVR